MIESMQPDSVDIVVSAVSSGECGSLADALKAVDMALKPNRVAVIRFHEVGMGQFFRTVVDACEGTAFGVADLLFCRMGERFAEPVVVFCRKDEIMTFVANKKQSSEFGTGQKLYSPFYNVLDAFGGDTLASSVRSVDAIVDLYVPDGERSSWTMLDIFCSDCQTTVSARSHGMKHIGIQFSKEVE